MHPDHPWACARPDDRLEDGALVVVKDAPHFTSEDFAEDGPGLRWLWATVQHELAVTGQRRAVFGLRVAGGWERYGWLSAEPAWQADLLAREAEFVRRLETGEAPAPASDGHDAAELDAIKALWPDGGGGQVTLGQDTLSRWKLLKLCRQTIRAATAKAKRIEKRLRYDAGAHERLLLPGGVKLSLKATTQGRRLVEVRR